MGLGSPWFNLGACRSWVVSEKTTGQSYPAFLPPLESFLICLANATRHIFVKYKPVYTTTLPKPVSSYPSAPEERG